MVIKEHLIDGFLLFRAQFCVERGSNFSTHSSFILQLHVHPVEFEYGKHLIDTRSRKPNVLGEVLTAGYDARLPIGRESHGLGSVEFRILKGSDANQAIQHGRRQIFLFDVDKIAHDHADCRWQWTFGGGKIKPTGVIDVAVIQSLQRKGDVEDFVGDYGHVIVDECHHLSAVTFERVLRQVKAKYVLGLTATPIRKDGHHPIIYMQCGPIRFHLTAKKAAQASLLEHKVIPRFTDFVWDRAENEITIQDLYAALVGNQHRNELIIRDLQNVLSAGRSPLVLTSRTEHLDYLAGRLHEACSHIFILKGGMGARQRRKLTESLAAAPPDEPRVILATGSYLGEGFDDARLDTLLLAMPVSWRGTLQQYVGRLHRLHENKKEVQVYDYADVLVPMLARMYKKRLAGYGALGYAVVEEFNV